MIALSSPGCVLAASQTGRPAIRPESCATTRGSAGGGGCIELDVAGHDDARRAEPRQPLRILGGLGEAEGEALEQAPR